MPTIALLATLVLCACGGSSSNNSTATLAAPNLTNASAQFFTLNAPIPEVVFANSGGSVATSNGCSVDTSDGKPMLPGGLMLASVVVDGKTTCQISGALTEAIAAPVTVSITATNATGFDTATVSVTQTFMPALNLSFVSRDRFTFAEFDNPGNQESPDEIMVLMEPPFWLMLSTMPICLPLVGYLLKARLLRASMSSVMGSGTRNWRSIIW